MSISLEFDGLKLWFRWVSVTVHLTLRVSVTVHLGFGDSPLNSTCIFGDGLRGRARGPQAMN
jgi:hypothetical protein